MARDVSKAYVALDDAEPPEGSRYEDFGPQPGPQSMFLASEADIVIYGGMAGGGKTYGLLLDAGRYVSVPYYSAVIFRRITKELTAEGGLWDESMEIYPLLGGDPIQGNLEWRFKAFSWTEDDIKKGRKMPSGPDVGQITTVRFTHMEHEKNRFDWAGAQIPYIGFDQLESFTRKQFFFMLSRNRSTSGVRPVMRATANPATDHWLGDLIAWWIDQEEFDENGGTNLNYGLPIMERAGVVRYFVQIENEVIWADEPESLYSHIPADLLTPEVSERDFVKSLTFIPASVYDNLALLRKNPQYVGNLFAMERVEREQLLRGNWKVKMEAGKVFPRDKVTIISAIPRGSILYRVRWWDFAGTKEADITSSSSARTASVRLSLTKEKRIIIEDFVAGWWEEAERIKMMKQVAELDGRVVAIRFEQEPGSAGKDVRLSTIREFHGFDIKGRPSTGGKETRWKPLAAQWQAGNVDIVSGPWNREFINEMNAVPDGRLDAADASSSGYNEIMRGEDEPSTVPTDYKTVRG